MHKSIQNTKINEKHLTVESGNYHGVEFTPL